MVQVQIQGKMNAKPKHVLRRSYLPISEGSKVLLLQYLQASLSILLVLLASVSDYYLC
jgi:hypothetical protein